MSHREEAIVRQLLRRELAVASDVPPWWEDVTASSSAGVRAFEPSGLVMHRGFLLLFSAAAADEHAVETSPARSACPLRFSYLRPGSRRWQQGFAPLVNGSRPVSRCAANESGFPAWWSQGIHRNGSASESEPSDVRPPPRRRPFRLRAPSALWDPLGRLPDASGRPRQHLALYYHVFVPVLPSHGGASVTFTACIGRLSAYLRAIDATCEPRLDWEDDGAPIVCDIHFAAAAAGPPSAANITLNATGNITAAINATLTDENATSSRVAASTNTSASNATATNASTANTSAANTSTFARTDAAHAAREGEAMQVSRLASSFGIGRVERRPVARAPHVFRGFDGQLYMVIGGSDAVHGFKLNASKGRLPEASSTLLHPICPLSCS